jgi:hypothetical protein
MDLNQDVGSTLDLVDDDPVRKTGWDAIAEALRGREKFGVSRVVKEIEDDGVRESCPCPGSLADTSPAKQKEALLRGRLKQSRVHDSVSWCKSELVTRNCTTT